MDTGQVLVVLLLLLLLLRCLVRLAFVARMMRVWTQGTLG